MARTGWQTPWVRAATTLLTLAVMAMIFCFSMETAEQSDSRSGRISDKIIWLFYPSYEQMETMRQEEVYETVQHAVRKCAHFTEYMMLGFMLRLCLESWIGHRIRRRRIHGLAALGAGTAYACTDEMHQLAIDGRSGQWTDVLVDVCGVLAGVALGSVLIGSLDRMNEDRP